MKQSKRVENPDILTLVMMQMRVEAKERAHDRREKVEDCRKMVTDQKQLVEMMVGIASVYFASRGGWKEEEELNWV